VTRLRNSTYRSAVLKAKSNIPSLPETAVGARGGLHRRRKIRPRDCAVWGPRIHDKAQSRSWTLRSTSRPGRFERRHRSDNRAHASTYGECTDMARGGTANGPLRNHESSPASSASGGGESSSSFTSRSNGRADCSRNGGDIRMMLLDAIDAKTPAQPSCLELSCQFTRRDSISSSR